MNTSCNPAHFDNMTEGTKENFVCFRNNIWHPGNNVLELL
jgi:hypothetical protein